MCGQIRLLYRFEPAAHNITPEKTYDGDGTSHEHHITTPKMSYVRLLKVYTFRVFIVVLDHIYDPRELSMALGCYALDDAPATSIGVVRLGYIVSTWQMLC